MDKKLNPKETRALFLNAPRFLSRSAQLWFSIAVIGQWIFVYYIAAYYLPILRLQGFEGLSTTHLPNGFISGDFWGNFAISAHIVIAIVILGGGTLQPIGWVRKRFLNVHRFIGRIYVILSILTSLAGLYLVWSRGVLGGLVGQLAISLDALLIIAFAVIATRYAMVGNIRLHRRWALRLFMVVSAVWFFRIGLMLWVALTGGIGIDFKSFTGPFVSFLYFAQILIPLLMLELYFLAGDRPSHSFKGCVGGLIVISAILTAMGIVQATTGMWLPRI